MASMEKVGSWAFIAGVIIAILAGLLIADAATLGIASAALVVVGLIVGVLNVADKEVVKFIVAAIGLTIGASAVAGLGALLSIPQLTSVFTLFSLFVAGAVFIPALKAIYSVSKD